MKLSAVVLTSNNKTVIKNVLNSLVFCDEILVIDDNSHDETVNIIKSLKNPKIKIITKSLNNDFASQRNFGLENSKGDWVLFIDSDEEVTAKLAQEVLEKIAQAKFNGYFLKRTDIFMGRKLNHGETGRIKLLRLAQKNAGLWYGKVHEIWQIKGVVGSLQNPIIHHHKLNISQFLDNINFYTSLQANDLNKQGFSEPICYHFLKPVVKFFQNFILRLGFLDGYPGLVMAWLMSWHSLLVRIKLKLLNIKTYPDKSSLY